MAFQLVHVHVCFCNESRQCFPILHYIVGSCWRMTPRTRSRRATRSSRRARCSQRSMWRGCHWTSVWSSTSQPGTGYVGREILDVLTTSLKWHLFQQNSEYFLTSYRTTSFVPIRRLNFLLTMCTCSVWRNTLFPHLSDKPWVPYFFIQSC